MTKILCGNLDCKFHKKAYCTRNKIMMVYDGNNTVCMDAELRREAR